MKYALPFVFAGVFASSIMAQDTASETDETIFLGNGVEDLSQFVWTKRPIIVFAESPNDPNFAQQMQYLEDRQDELAVRDVVVITDTDPSNLSPLRRQLRPRSFMLVLIGKDGGVKLRKPFPWDVREISRSIDKMPLRQREIRDRNSRDRSG
ncbi:MAG: DUF4174 domain-containing protein [Pseudomonadota bacterium]